MARTEHRDQSPLSFPVLPHSRPVPRRRVPGHRREVFASGPVQVFLGYCVATAPVLFIVSLQETPALGSLGTHMRGRVPPWLWGLQPGGVRGEVERPGFGSTFLWVPFEVIWGACVCGGVLSRAPAGSASHTCSDYPDGIYLHKTVSLHDFVFTTQRSLVCGWTAPGASFLSLFCSARPCLARGYERAAMPSQPRR